MGIVLALAPVIPGASATPAGQGWPMPSATDVESTPHHLAANQLDGTDGTDEHGQRATVLINSPVLGPPGSLTPSDLRASAVDASEIGGRIVTDPDLTTRATAPAQAPSINAPPSPSPASTGVSYPVVLTGVLLMLAVGVNVFVWSAVGLARWVFEHSIRRRSVRRRCSEGVRPDQVAVLIAAHNEELGVASSVTAALALVPPGNVFVVSDGSTDETVDRARTAGATVHELQPNRGKAGALSVGIAAFDLAGRFEVVMLLDADTAPTPDYLLTGLPQFDDPGVVAVAGTAATVWNPVGRSTVVGRCLRAYRERQYVLFQALIKYGQAAEVANVLTIVPGFASMYRTRILADIDIAAPGLAIEDFNMTFEVHARRLGRIAFHPGAALAYTQDPDTLPDYCKQVRRWSLGFWQTVRRHGIHRGRFWFSLAAFVTELLTSNLFFILFGPLLLLVTTAQLWSTLLGTTGTVGAAAAEAVSLLPLQALLLGVVVPDLVLTVGVAVVQRRPMYLLVGVTFLPLRCLDAWLCLSALRRTRVTASPGTWASPARRPPAITSHLKPARGRALACRTIKLGDGV